MADAIPIRLGSIADNEWPSRLPVYAVASGDAQAWEMLHSIFGPGVDLPELREQAAGAWRVSREGLHVTVEKHPTLKLNPDGPAHSGADCLRFDPWDNGHHREQPDNLVVFKRSVGDKPAPNECAYPAWVRKGTLDLTCGPARATDVPIVSFCGVTHRPPIRRNFLARFETTECVDARITRRAKFYYPDQGAFLDSIRASHFVLCPHGMGRWSYRLYETLAAGRIPIVPPSEHSLPAPLMANAYICIASTPEEIRADWDRLLKHRLADIHAKNRAAWIKYASPLGALVWMAGDVRRRLETNA